MDKVCSPIAESQLSTIEFVKKEKKEQNQERNSCRDDQFFFFFLILLWNENSVQTLSCRTVRYMSH